MTDWSAIWGIAVTDLGGQSLEDLAPDGQINSITQALIGAGRALLGIARAETMGGRPHKTWPYSAEGASARAGDGGHGGGVALLPPPRTAVCAGGRAAGV